MAQERALVVSAQELDKLRRALASVGFLNAASAASGGEARRRGSGYMAAGGHQRPFAR